MKRLCVFCGSALGARAEYGAAARAVAAELARRRLGLVYGGGSVGLMGVLADAALAAGVEVIGVIPRPLASRELAHAGPPSSSTACSPGNLRPFRARGCRRRRRDGAALGGGVGLGSGDHERRGVGPRREATHRDAHSGRWE